MKLTRIQAATLEAYARYQRDGLGVGTILRVNWWRWLLLGAVCVGAYAWMRERSPVGSTFVAGLCVGAFVRDIGRLQVAIRTWPVMREVLDWKKVTDLLAARSKASS